MPKNPEEHPLVGKIAVCQQGRIGYIRRVIRRRGRKPFFCGVRLCDGSAWETSRPVFLSLQEVRSMMLLEKWYELHGEEAEKQAQEEGWDLV